jgi:hypothetical protein
MKWKATIEKTGNGYILTTSEGKESNILVFNEPDANDETNRDHFISVLYELIDYFSEGGQKYDKRRVKVCYTVGDGHELKDASKDVKFDVI